MIGCHLCNKSIRETSWLPNIPRSTVSGIITKWKQLGTTATQPQSAGSVHAEMQNSPTVCGVNS
ncbi:unnamed protein product [Staurois parvus]|uniref:Transposase n=1 Tax=Staurois parvus TaxID=386267 RepID=A0ABN9GH23_9NEOB|nr:unnamed protein product [Staurois parvus]